MAPLSNAWDALRSTPYMACSLRPRGRATSEAKTHVAQFKFMSIPSSVSTQAASMSIAGEGFPPKHLAELETDLKASTL